MDINALDKRSIKAYGDKLTESLKHTMDKIGCEMTDKDKEIVTTAVNGSLILYISDIKGELITENFNDLCMDEAEGIYENVFLPYFKDKGIEVFSEGKPFPEGKEFFLTETDKKLLISDMNTRVRQFAYSIDSNHNSLKEADNKLIKDFNEYLHKADYKSDEMDMLKNHYRLGNISFEEFLKESIQIMEQEKAERPIMSDTSHVFKLTEKGMETVRAYIEELKAKQKEILDAGIDTADEVELPTVEDILSDIEFMGLDDDGVYYNNWAVTNEYDGDNALCLELGEDKDFIHNELYRDNNSKGIVAESPFSMVTNDEQDIER